MPTAGRLTTFLPQKQASTFLPFYDPQRVYTNDHAPNVYTCTNDGTWRTFHVLDLPQRRWYEVNIHRTWYEANIDTSATWPPPPLSEAEQDAVEDLVAHHISQQSCPFNTVNIDGAGSATYKIEASIGVPLRRQPIVSDSAFPTVYHEIIMKKRYLDRAIDICEWNGKVCLYKQLEFDGLIPQMRREISTREAICDHFSKIDPAQLATLGITPILAVVVQGDPPLLCGILMPHAGITLEHASHDRITVRHLLSLVKTVGYLCAAGVLHGDICARNVCIDGGSTQLIDFGEMAPGYRNDVVAAGELLLWCAERIVVPDEVKARVTRAARELIEREDINAALDLLG